MMGKPDDLATVHTLIPTAADPDYISHDFYFEPLTHRIVIKLCSNGEGTAYFGEAQLLCKRQFGSDLCTDLAAHEEALSVMLARALSAIAAPLISRKVSLTNPGTTRQAANSQGS